MEWGTTEAVVSIHSLGRGSHLQRQAQQAPAAQTQPSVAASTPPAVATQQEDAEPPVQQVPTPRNKRTSASPSPSVASASGTPVTTPRHTKNRSSGGGSLRSRSTLASSGYGLGSSYDPFAPLLNEGSGAVAPAAAPTPYLGMQTSRTEWLLPTRVSVAERTTTTMVAKSTLKSPKSSKDWKGYIPTNQHAPFDLRLSHPKVLGNELPPAPLPGTKSAQYEGVIQRVPVSEAATRASIAARTEKSGKAARGLNPAVALEEEIERRRADKRLRFEHETERAKEALWRETQDTQAKQIMLAEERAFVDDLRAKIRAARLEREEKWRAEELRVRQKENLELRIPEARLAKYERWLREEQEADVRAKYFAETGEQAPLGYGRSSLTPAHEEKQEEEDEPELEVDDIAAAATVLTPSVPPMRVLMDQGRPVESHFGSNGHFVGIEFAMVTESDPDANTPLFVPHPVVVATPVPSLSATVSPAHTRGPSHSNVQPGHSHNNSLGGGGGGGHHRPQASYGSIGNLSQLGFGDVLLEADAEVDEEERSAVEQKEISERRGDFTPELSAMQRGATTSTAEHTPGHARELSHSTRVGHTREPSQSARAGHARELSHSTRAGPVSLAGLVDPTGGNGDYDDTLDFANEQRPSRSTRSPIFDEGSSREASRARLRGEIIAEEAPAAAAAVASSPSATPAVCSPAPNASPESPPVHGDADLWNEDEAILAGGITVMKLPRKSGMFSSAKRTQLFLTHGTEASTMGSWLLSWDSKAKSSEADFIQLSGMKEFVRGMTAGAFKTKDGKKYANQPTHCFTLVIPGRDLDVVIESQSHCEVLERVLTRICHPSGAHRAPPLDRAPSSLNRSPSALARSPVSASRSGISEQSHARY